jgi:two-component system cell cycle sensor histidine kinase/response regulator CckA
MNPAMQFRQDNNFIARFFSRPPQPDKNLPFLAEALSQMPWGILIADDGHIVFCNGQASLLLFQAEPEKLLGMEAKTLFRLAGVDIDLTLDENSVNNERQIYVESQRKWLRIQQNRSSGKNDRLYFFVEDMTQTKLLDGQYNQSSRLEALGQLAGGVAHDFNNILSIIDGYARISKKAADGNNDIANFMNHISTAVKRGAALTSQLLTFGRHKVVKSQILNIGNVIKDQEILLRSLLDASIRLSLSVEDDVYAEASQDNIWQILLNLCTNARDAMPEGGSLIIECRKDLENKKAVIRVLDEGQGIPQDKIEKIFDPFFTTKSQKRGTGLGLSVVYGLVRDMKGDISVESKVGKGAVFTIDLPLKENNSNIKIMENADGSFRLSGFTALIAEDEPDLLEIISGMMEEMGAKVIRASNGSEALMLQDDFDGNIDFLLTDVVMPEMNGVKLAELFGAVRPDSKVLFMSGYPAQGQMARVPLPEGAYLMPKPINFEQLCNVVKSMIRNDNDNAAVSRIKKITGEWKSA